MTDRFYGADDDFYPPRRSLGDVPRASGSRRPETATRVAVRINQLLNALFEPEPRFPAEPPEGTVLKWVKTLGSRKQEYTYVALRAGGRWYLTGKTSVGITWVELVEQIGGSPCDLAIDWAEIPQSEPGLFENTSPSEWYMAMYPKKVIASDGQEESES